MKSVKQLEEFAAAIKEVKLTTRDVTGMKGCDIPYKVMENAIGKVRKGVPVGGPLKALIWLVASIKKAGLLGKFANGKVAVASSEAKGWPSAEPLTWEVPGLDIIQYESVIIGDYCYVADVHGKKFCIEKSVRKFLIDGNPFLRFDTGRKKSKLQSLAKFEDEL